MWPFGERPGRQDPVEKYRRWLRKWLMGSGSNKVGHSKSRYYRDFFRTGNLYSPPAYIFY